MKPYCILVGISNHEKKRCWEWILFLKFTNPLWLAWEVFSAGTVHATSLGLTTAKSLTLNPTLRVGLGECKCGWGEAEGLRTLLEAIRHDRASTGREQCGSTQQSIIFSGKIIEIIPGYFQSTINPSTISTCLTELLCGIQTALTWPFSFV